tara:strand:+ start:474 stop:860 length:387 start_codon:yes stop_codon:yes gene_type:complete
MRFSFAQHCKSLRHSARRFALDDFQSYRNLSDAALDSRKIDSHLKAKIDSHMGDNDKAAIIFGAGHFSSEHVLKTLLGLDNTRWVNIGVQKNDIDSIFHTTDLVILVSPQQPIIEFKLSPDPRSTALV